MVTTKEIAATLGVAVSTVGRALADDPRISEATKERVRKAASKLGYVGNVPARVMRGASSRLVGLIVPNILNDFYATIAQELSQSCDFADYQLALSISGDDGETELKRLRELIASRVAGIVIVPTPNPRPETLKLLSNIPHVQLLRRVDSLSSDWFGIQDAAAVRDATQYLIACGHQRIAYVGGLETISTGRDRLAGYRDAHRGARLAVRASCVKLGLPTAEFGCHATAALLKRAKPPTAIAYGSIQATLGGMQAIDQASIRVPQDVSIMGFGDPVWFQWWRSGLSTMSLPIGDLAHACATRFLERLELRGSAHLTGAPYEDKRAATLVVRGSVAHID